MTDFGRNTAARATERSSSVLRGRGSFEDLSSYSPELVAARETWSVTIDNSGEVFGRVIERFSNTASQLLQETNTILRQTAQENSNLLRSIALGQVSARANNPQPQQPEETSANLNPAAQIGGISNLHPLLTDPATLKAWIRSTNPRKKLGPDETRQIAQALGAYNFQLYMVQSFGQWFEGEEQEAFYLLIYGRSKAGIVELIKDFCMENDVYMYWVRKLRVDAKWGPKPLVRLDPRALKPA